MSIFDALNEPYEILQFDDRLTDEQVAEIRRLYASGGYRQIDLAAEYGVSQPYVSRIINYKRKK